MKENERSAQGVEGFLLRTIDGGLIFRIYDPDNKRVFKDYEVSHHDLRIKIMDDYSSFYEKERENGLDGYIDYPSKLFKNHEGESLS